jgi:N,N'-diacetyllegionaminate synthase
MSRTLIIAEAGVNHNGSMEMARQLIDAAAAAGVDYVKFQTFKAEKLVSAEAKKADYQVHNTRESGSQLEMLKKLELDPGQHKELIAYCRQKNVKFLSTAFDLDSIDLLNSLNIQLFKIPSGEITNLPYLEKIGSLKKQVIISTGMCVMSEIAEAIDVLVKNGTNRDDITVLHCTTDYPTLLKDVNLKAMLNIQRSLNVKVGYSDHTLGIIVPVAAVAMGAVVIEKHFTLDRSLPGPDHIASLIPDELKEMVDEIRNVETALGNADKKPTATEEKNMLVARKSIHLTRDMKKGEMIRSSDLIMKRPGDGISPMKMNLVIGKKLSTDLPAETKLKREDLE